MGSQKSGKLNEILIQSKCVIFQKPEVSYSEKLRCKPDLDNGYAY